jgi:hypothetical protein
MRPENCLSLARRLFNTNHKSFLSSYLRIRLSVIKGVMQGNILGEAKFVCVLLPKSFSFFFPALFGVTRVVPARSPVTLYEIRRLASRCRRGSLFF